MSERSPAPAPRSPSAPELLRLLRRLAKAGRSVDVIRVAEKWSDDAALPREARLVASRAMLDLLLLDRAWVQLRELTVADPQDLEAQLLTAAVFIERGWTERAVRILDKVEAIEPAHPRLSAMRADAAQRRPDPPADVRALERDGAPAEVLAAAEGLLRAGSSLRAQGVLERLLPRAGALAERVEALLWGLRGDFTSEHDSLAALAASVQERLPAPTVLPRSSPAQALDVSEWDSLELTESGLSLEPETAEITRSHAAGFAQRAEGSFPSLFRGGDADDVGLADDEEVTVATVMAGAEDMADPPTAEDTDASYGFDEEPGGDTQILEVIRPTDAAESADAFGTDADSPSQTFDLRTMGQGARPRPVEEETGHDGFLEEEDRDLVVMTRRPRAAAPAVVPRTERAPIQVVEKVPQPPPLPENMPGEDEDTPSLTPLVPDPAAPASESTPSEPAPPESGGVPRLVWVAGGAALLLVLAAMAFAAASAMSGGASPQAKPVEAVLLDARYPSLRSRAAAVKGSWAGPGEEALVHAALWLEYTGDPADREAAVDAIAAARVSTTADARERAALASAMLALGDGHVSDAQAALAATPGTSPLAALLRARVALEAGDPAAALGALPGSLSLPPHGQMWRAVVQAEAGDPESARTSAAAAFDASQGDPRVQLLALEHDLLAPPASGLDALSAEPSLQAPRLQARLLALESRLARPHDPDRASAAADAALRLDPSLTALRVERAHSMLVGGDVLAAEREASRCLEARRGDDACSQALIMARLELDRVEQARASIDAWRADGRDVTVLDAWVAYAEGDAERAQRRARELVAQDGPAEQRGLAWFVLGHALAAEHAAADRTVSSLEWASRLLAESDDPWMRRLALRADAARLAVGDPVRASAYAAELPERLVDPIAAAHKVGWLVAMGDEEAAQALCAQAQPAGEERALAQLAFARACPDAELAARAADAYLALSPSGPRAPG